MKGSSDYLPENSKRRLAHSRILVGDHGSNLRERLRGFACTNTKTFQQASEFIECPLPRLRNLGLQAMLEQELKYSTVCVDLRKSLDNL